MPHSKTKNEKGFIRYEPGAWFWAAPEYKGSYIMVDCGLRAMIRDHKVDEDGKVTPSICCPHCEWHVWGILEGYNG